MIEETTKKKAHYTINIMICEAVLILLFILPGVPKRKYWYNIITLSIVFGILIICMYSKFKNYNVIYLAPAMVIALDYFRLYNYEVDQEGWKEERDQH